MVNITKYTYLQSPLYLLKIMPMFYQKSEGHNSVEYFKLWQKLNNILLYQVHHAIRYQLMGHLNLHSLNLFAFD
jgi:hypothetical protein